VNRHGPWRHPKLRHVINQQRFEARRATNQTRVTRLMRSTSAADRRSATISCPRYRLGSQVTETGECKACHHQIEPDPSEMAAKYGAGTAVLDWRRGLVWPQCSSRQVDLVVTGTERRTPS